MESRLETCQSGLMCLFAKEVGFNRPRWFESSRLRRRNLTQLNLGKSHGYGFCLDSKPV